MSTTDIYSKIPKLQQKQSDLNNNLCSRITKLQEQLAKKVIMKDDFHDKEIDFVCGVDVSYKNGIAHCFAVIIKTNTLEIIEIANSRSKIRYPYIPGLFLLRELKPIELTLRLLKSPYQLLLVDGNGLLHPRKCGLACHIGLITNIPTIGVAKKLLCGCIQSDGFVKLDEDLVGYSIEKVDNKNKRIYICIGHKISLLTSIQLIQSLTKKGKVIPEPLRIADIACKKSINK